MRHATDTDLGSLYTQIIFPGWCDHPSFGPCAYSFKMHQKIEPDEVIKMAKTLKCILELEVNGDLEVIDYSKELNSQKS